MTKQVVELRKIESRRPDQSDDIDKQHRILRVGDLKRIDSGQLDRRQKVLGGQAQSLREDRMAIHQRQVRQVQFSVGLREEQRKGAGIQPERGLQGGGVIS